MQPDVGLRVGDLPLHRWRILRGEIHSKRLPIIANESHESGGTDDANGMPGFLAAVVAVRVEVTKARLHVGNDAVPVVEQQHGEFFGARNTAIGLRDVLIAARKNLRAAA